MVEFKCGKIHFHRSAGAGETHLLADSAASRSNTIKPIVGGGLYEYKKAQRIVTARSGNGENAHRMIQAAE